MGNFLFRSYIMMPYCILRILDCIIGLLTLGHYIPTMAFGWTRYIERKYRQPAEQMGS